MRLASAGAALWRYVSGHFSLTWARQRFDVDRVCDTLISWLHSLLHARDTCLHGIKISLDVSVYE